MPKKEFGLSLSDVNTQQKQLPSEKKVQRRQSNLPFARFTCLPMVGADIQSRERSTCTSEEVCISERKRRSYVDSLLQYQAARCSLLKDVHSTLLRVIDTAVLCPGNPEAHFVTLCTKRRGEDKALVEQRPGAYFYGENSRLWVVM